MTNSKLSEIAQQIIALETQREDIALEIKACTDAAKHYGYSASALKAAIKLARMTPEQREAYDDKQRTIFDYLGEIEADRDIADVYSRNRKEAAE